MKLVTTTTLIATLGFAHISFAQAVRAPKQPTRPAVQAPKAQTPQQKASKTDQYLSTLSQLKNGKRLNGEVAANTCNGTSLVQAVASVLKGSEKTAFTRAASIINGGSQGVVLQSCQAGEPITQEDSLKNLAKMVIYVGNKIQRNEGSATDVNLWAEGLRSTIPGITTEGAVERVKGLASSKCQLLTNLNI